MSVLIARSQTSRVGPQSCGPPSGLFPIHSHVDRSLVERHSSNAMPRPVQTEIRIRLVVETPVPSVAYSLQDKKSLPVDVKKSKGEPILFEFSVRVAEGPKFFGEHVRSEGPLRRFVYIATGQQAGQKDSFWSRRMKVDIHTIPDALIAQAAKGRALEATVRGTGSDGTPACASVPLTNSWHAV